MTKENFIQVADSLKLNVAALQAVADVESNGGGMFEIEGRLWPVILFEPHIFWRQLKAVGINPQERQKGFEDVLYEKWKTRPYPRTQAERHKQLAKACFIHREAALQSASWGRFQIMGFNFKDCGCETIQEFINAMYKGESEHLRLFGNFIKTRGLVPFLQKRDWASFALKYNGKSYKVHNYDGKLANAYKKYSS